jgi:hypothetical protein
VASVHCCFTCVLYACSYYCVLHGQRALLLYLCSLRLLLLLCSPWPVCTAVVPVFSTLPFTIVLSMASVHLCTVGPGTISGPIQFFGLSLFYFV